MSVYSLDKSLRQLLPFSQMFSGTKANVFVFSLTLNFKENLNSRLGKIKGTNFVNS